MSIISASKHREGDVGSSEQSYRGFISYSQRDRRFARRLHRALEAYRAPDGVRSDKIDTETGRIGSFFRDDDELAAESDLSEALDRKIDGAESLIVLCSPHSAKSKWVDKEVRRFKRRGEGRVFAVIVAGAPHAADPKNECLCPALKVKVDAAGDLTSQAAEPLAPHWRKEGVKRLTAKLAAGLIEVRFDDLWKRERRQAASRLRRRVVVVGSVLIAIAAVLFSNLRLQAIERSSTLALLSAKGLELSLTGGQNEASSDRALRFGVIASREWWLEPASKLAEPSLARAAAMSNGVWETKTRDGVAQARLFDGNTRLALMGEEGWIEVLDVATGELVAVEALDGKVVDIAAGAQEQLTLAVAETNDVRLWTLGADGLERGGVISSEKDADVMLAPGGERALVFDTAGSHIWEAESGFRTPLDGAGQYELDITSFSRDGKVLVGLTVTDMGVWNARTGKLIDTHPRYYQSEMVISGDSRHVLAVAENAMLVEWILAADGASLEAKQTLQVDSFGDGSFNVIEASTDGSRLYFAAYDGGDSTSGAGGWAALTDGAISAYVSEFDAAPELVRFSAGADLFLTVHADQRLRISRVEDGESEAPAGLLDIDDSESAGVSDALFVDAWRFVTVTRGGSLRLWDANGMGQHSKLAEGAFVPKQTASEVEVQAAERLESALMQLQESDYFDWRVNAAAVSPDGSRVAGIVENIAGGYADIVVASATTYETFGKSIGGEYDLASLAFTADGREIHARGHIDGAWALPKWIVGPGDRARAGLPSLAGDICNPAAGRLGGRLRVLTPQDLEAAPVLLGGGWRAGDDVCNPPTAWMKFMRWLENPLGGF